MYSGSRCPHESHQIEYICTCSELLCRRCITSHENVHRSRNEGYQIQNILVVRDEMKNTIQQCMTSLDVHRRNIAQYKQEIYESRQFKEGFELLHKAQNEIKKLVNAFFKVLEEKFSEECRNSKIEYEQNLDEAEGRLNYMLETFKDLLHGVSSTQTSMWQKSLRVSMDFDFQTELNRIGSEIEQAVQEKFFIAMNTKYTNPLLQELHNYIQISTDRPNNRVNSSNVSNGDILTELKKSERLMNTSPHRDYNLKASVPVEDHLLSRLQNNGEESTYGGGGGNFPEFEVKQPNFFHHDCPHKILHFFESNSKNLYIIPIRELETEIPQCHRIELKILMDIPARHRSLITPFGDIFLTGGSRDEGDKSEILNGTYKLNYLNGALLPKQRMINSRKSHGFCYMEGYLYAIGGYNEKFGALPFCERYSISHDKWTPIAETNYRTSSPSVCAFNKRFIYKYGGLLGTAQVNEHIERYDAQLDKWTIVQIKNKTEDLRRIDFKVFWLSASCQINNNAMLVFGGCDENNLGTKQSFMLEVTDGEGVEGKIRKKNELSLPLGAGFWNSQCVIQNGKMYVLQNELREDDQTHAYENNRNLLVFDSNSWHIFKV